MKAFQKKIPLLKGVAFTFHVSVIPAFEKLRQKKQQFKSNRGYTVRSCLYTTKL